MDRGAEEFKKAAQALNAAADKTLRREVYAGFRRAAKPLGIRVIASASEEMPHRGGLSMRIAASKMGQANSTTGRNPSVTLNFRSAQGYDLAAMDKGMLRHPVFGQSVWVTQPIRAGAFTRPFNAGADGVRKEMLTALRNVNDDIVRQSKGAR